MIKKKLIRMIILLAGSVVIFRMMPVLPENKPAAKAEIKQIQQTDVLGVKREAAKNPATPTNMPTGIPTPNPTNAPPAKVEPTSQPKSESISPTPTNIPFVPPAVEPIEPPIVIPPTVKPDFPPDWGCDCERSCPVGMNCTQKDKLWDICLCIQSVAE